MLTAFKNGVIFTGKEKIANKTLLVEKGLIVDLISPEDIPSNAKVIDLTGNYLAPGLIDLQIYGSGGRLLGAYPDSETLRQMECDLLSAGTTGFLATVATNSDETVEKAIEASVNYRKAAIGNFLGLHLEGPFLNPKRRGAHPEKYIKKGDVNTVKKWVKAASGEIKMITIAPELQSRELTDYLNDSGIIISAGHTDATYTEALSFLSQSVQAATHLYNAMSPIHHRSPGIIPAIFERQPYTSIVADGIHVSFPMISLAKRELGDKLFLITDAVTETWEGEYRHKLHTDHYTLPDGTLSGSSLTLLKAVENCTKHAGIPLDEALRMGSIYPAKLLRSDKTEGFIKRGYKANLLCFNKLFEVVNVWLSNQINGI